jgi:hypothetical protein
MTPSAPSRCPAPGVRDLQHQDQPSALALRGRIKQLGRNAIVTLALVEAVYGEGHASMTTRPQQAARLPRNFAPG